LLPPLAKPLLHQVDASSAATVMSSLLLMPSLCSQDNPWFLAVIFNLLDWMVRFHWINVPSWSVLLGPVSAPQEIFLIHQPMHQFLLLPLHQFLHPPQHQFLTQPLHQFLHPPLHQFLTLPMPQFLHPPLHQFLTLPMHQFLLLPMLQCLPLPMHQFLLRRPRPLLLPQPILLCLLQ
jgi:hypothetical protein